MWVVLLPLQSVLLLLLFSYNLFYCSYMTPISTQSLTLKEEYISISLSHGHVLFVRSVVLGKRVQGYE